MDRRVCYTGNKPGNPPAGFQVKKPTTCQISKSWKPAGGVSRSPFVILDGANPAFDLETRQVHLVSVWIFLLYLVRQFDERAQ